MAQLEYTEPNQKKKLSVLDKYLELLSSFFKIENNSVLKEAFLILEDITKYNTLNSNNKNQDLLWSKKLNELSDFISQKSQENTSFQQFQQSLNKPNTNPILRGNQTNIEEIITQLEKDGLLEIDCKGKLKAEKGLATSFVKGGKWKVIKDLKGYPTHKEGGVDLTIGKNGVSIKNGNTQFTAKHGLVIPKAQNGLTIPSWMNPKNWGVPDYSDKYKTQGEAYKNAQDKSEFLYNGVRIKKDIASDIRNPANLQIKNNWGKYKNY